MEVIASSSPTFKMIMTRDMWKKFQRKGRVKDIFISKRLNVRNQRFDFVKFHEVVNVEALENRLNII